MKAKMQEDTIKSYFQEDHERLGNLLKKFRIVSARDIESGRKPFEKFKRGLEQHITWEEEILFPLFESKTGMSGGGPTHAMRFEHKELKTLLKSIEKRINEGQASEDQVDKLIKYLTHHNYKEENMLYAMIDESVSREERQEVFKKINGGFEASSGGCCCGHGH